jgi:hypothetical protein
VVVVSLSTLKPTSRTTVRELSKPPIDWPWNWWDWHWARKEEELLDGVSSRGAGMLVTRELFWRYSLVSKWLCISVYIGGPVFVERLVTKSLNPPWKPLKYRDWSLPK